MGQQEGLEEEDDHAEKAYGRRAEEDGAKPCPCHVGAAPEDGGDLEGGDHKDEGAGHGQQDQGLPVLLKCPFQGEVPGQEKRQAQNAPGDAEAARQVALHDVHGMGLPGGPEDEGGNCRRGDEKPLSLSFGCVYHEKSSFFTL